MQCETEFLNNKVFLAIANIVGPTASSGNDSKAPDSASCLSCLVDPALHISSDHTENAYFKWNPFSSFVAPHKILFNVTQNCDAVRTEEVRRNKNIYLLSIVGSLEHRYAVTFYTLQKVLKSRHRMLRSSSFVANWGFILKNALYDRLNIVFHIYWLFAILCQDFLQFHYHLLEIGFLNQPVNFPSFPKNVHFVFSQIK